MLTGSSDDGVGWGTGDPLSTVLLDLGLGGTFFCNTSVGAPWAMEVPPRDFASFHFVSLGDAWLRRGGERLRLGTGDLAFLPRSPRHILTGDRDTRRGVSVERLPQRKLGEAAASVRFGGRGRRALLICGGVHLRGPVAATFVALLPEVVVLRRAEAAPIVASALEAMREESLAARPGSVTLMTRLADVVLIHAIRAWLEGTKATRSGWLAALRDPGIGPAVAAIHQRPGEAWTVERLARAARMSRSIFAQRFTDLVGQTPMRYVTAVRMHHASEVLSREPVAIAELATRFGYDSEPAFARAFKRHVGQTPGAVRRRARRTNG